VPLTPSLKGHFSEGVNGTGPVAFLELLLAELAGLLSLGRVNVFPGAVQDCDEAIKRDPKFIRAYMRKGAALIAMKEFGYEPWSPPQSHQRER
jgi:hypothetical protein